MSSIRCVSSWSKKNRVLAIYPPNTWRLPFGRKINKYGVLAIYINLMENTRLPFGLKINKYGV